MKIRSLVHLRVACARAFLAVAGWGAASSLQAQDAAALTYMDGAACHSRFSPSEIRILAEGRLEVDEIPVVLFIGSQAGVSPEVLLTVRRGGTPWVNVAGRYGLGAATFHLPLGASSPGPLLSRAYEAFGAVSPREWDSVELTDAEVVALVNLRFLTEALGIPVARVLEVRTGAPDWVSAYVTLGGRGC